MAKKLLVTSSPHLRSGETTTTVMGDVLIALLPALVVSVVFFGFRALGLCLVSVACAMAMETLFNLICKRPNTVADLSSAVTGLLLAFCVPVTTPYWMICIGDFFAIVIVKMLFGGIGKNFFNPALAARAFLFSWPAVMTTFVEPFSSHLISIFGGTAAQQAQIDAITTATVLSELKNQGQSPDSLISLFLGNQAGCLGEVSAAMLLLGGVYLLCRKVITWHIPVSYIGTVALITFLFPKTGGMFDLKYMGIQILSGGLMLGAIFMATDYTTSPITKKGKIIYGVGCGVLTVFLRYFSGYPEGVSYAILLMNTLAFTLDKKTMPKRYGTGGAADDIG